MDKFETFKELWVKGRREISFKLKVAEENELVRSLEYNILLALNLLLEAKERALFPQDFTEE